MATASNQKRRNKVSAVKTNYQTHVKLVIIILDWPCTVLYQLNLFYFTFTFQVFKTKLLFIQFVILGVLMCIKGRQLR